MNRSSEVGGAQMRNGSKVSARSRTRSSMAAGSLFLSIRTEPAPGDHVPSTPYMGETSNRGHAVPDNLRHTLLLASALQVLRPDHRAVQYFQDAVRQRGEGAISTAKQAIDVLHTSERDEILSRFEDLCVLLPDEVLAA